MALGEVDYGLYGLVGGLTVCIAFLNNVLASAIGRFYAVSIGAAKVKDGKDGALEECRLWFNTAISVHTVVPVVLIVIGYPIGVWLLCDFIDLPGDRIEDCIFVFRCVCIACFVGMLNVPFQSMYTAKQYIAELTVYSYITTVANVVLLYHMVSHPGIWMCRYGMWACLLSVVPQIIIAIRAVCVFPECKFMPKYMFNMTAIRKLGGFACWQMIGIFSGIMRNQGMAILIAKAFGPRVNAAMAVGNSVNGHANNLAGAMMGAFSPAITSAFGAHELDRMRMLVFSACKFGTFLSMIFVVPLLAEMNMVLKLWLKDPPAYSAGFAALFLVIHLIENMTWGHMIAVNATGRIAAYQIIMGSVSLMALPLAIIWVCCGGGAYVIAYAIAITVFAYTFVRVVLARRIVGLPILGWMRKVVAPTLIMFAMGMLAAWTPRAWLGVGLKRMIASVVCAEGVLLPFAWFVLLSAEERGRVIGTLRRRLFT